MPIIKAFLLYLFLWIILSDAKIEIFPLLFLLLMSIMTPYMFKLKYEKIHLRATLKLFALFMYHSLRGSLQVAFFALKPKLNLEPFVYNYTLQTQSKFTTSILANLYSLMPGTLSMGYNEGVLSLHILDDALFDADLVKSFEEWAIEAFEGKTFK